jgi:hypothetical protein
LFSVDNKDFSSLKGAVVSVKDILIETFKGSFLKVVGRLR